MDTLAIILITAGLTCLFGAGIGYYTGYVNGLEEYRKRYNRHLKRVLNERHFDTDSMGGR